MKHRPHEYYLINTDKRNFWLVKLADVSTEEHSKSEKEKEVNVSYHIFSLDNVPNNINIWY